MSLVASAMGPDGDLVAERLARGCRCYVVWLDGTVGGYGWLSTTSEWIGEIQLEISPRAGEAYIWNCVTMPEHRRKGIFRSLLCGISAAARRGGLNRLWIGTLAIPAEKVMSPSGFRPALRFTVAQPAGAHVMVVRNSSDPLLAAAGRGALSIQPGLHVRRITRRRH